MLWTRFDTFRESNGNIFFAELNYDKPCAQKEIALAGSMNFSGNINELFEINFKNEFVKICSKKNKYCNVGILIDPCHYEEFHLATYIKDLLKDTNLTIYQVGPKNLSISENHVIAFEEIKLDVLVRLFPAEFSYEIDNFDKILKAFDDGNILILNDPRIVAIQAKTLFAYLWELILEDSPLLSYKEKNTIRNSLPFTKIFSKDDYNYVIKNKDNLVIKSSLGRYSGEVYLGKDFTPDNWKTQLDIILSSNKLHICQRLINIKKESTFRPIDEKSNLPTLAYANFGTFITKNKLIGICIRWSEDFLTSDESSFMCPLAIKDEPYYIEQYNYSDRKSKWNLINEESIFKYKFTGGYTNIYEYISLDKFIIKKEFYNEMLYASIEFCELLKKTNKLILENLSIFAPILGIDESLLPCITSSDSNFLCALGRIDFVIDIYNNLKILEFNSETPAGIIESTMITELINNEIYKNKTNIINPNVNLIYSIKIVFKDLINSLKSKSNIKNIAFLCTSYYEDLFNTSILIEILKDELEDISLLFGNIFDIEVIDNNVFLYGNKIDAIYRYYPLDWIVNEDELNKLIPLINKSVYFLNAPHTIVPQSKAYFAVIYELLKQGYYNNKESNFINKYIPLTSLTPLKNTGDFVIKPYLSKRRNWYNPKLSRNS